MFRFFLFLFFLSQMIVHAQLRMTVYGYIDSYSSLAIQEMQRSGIPASITLAQGILESKYGNSTLALEALNHFGIKCHNDWTGKTFFLQDDESSPSCFRVYLAVLSSYVDHSDFIVNNPRRYGFLFEYPKDSYKKWAHGLKKAGYATDSLYAQKLIDIIEKYNLTKFDNQQAIVEEAFPLASVELHPKIGEKKYSLFPVNTSTEILHINQVPCVIAQPGDTPVSVALRQNISVKKLLRYNDMDEGQEFIPYQYVFLKHKKAKSKDENINTHLVSEEGEAMYVIAQAYGIRKYALYSLNRLFPGLEPAIGSVIQLHDKANVPPLLRTDSSIKNATNPIDNDLNEEIPSSYPVNVPDENPKETIIDSTPQNSIEESTNTNIDNPSNENETENIEPIYLIYFVQKGDTLFSLAKSFNVSVAEIKAWNDLDSDLIKPGQQLKIEQRF